MAERFDTCMFCAFWNRNKTPTDAFGQCRRHAPLAVKKTGDRLSTAKRWPVTHEEDWCGDFEQKRGASE